jgi:hypothetical protein
MKNKFYSVFIMLMIASIISVEAQKLEGAAGFIQSGYLNAPNAKTLNQVYPENVSGFGNDYFLFGAEGFYRKNKNMFIGEWQFGLQKTYSFNDEHAGVVYETLLAKYARNIKDEKRIWIYPSAGAGASVIALTNYKDINGIKKNMTTNTLVSPTFDIGTNIDFLLSKLN